MNTDRYAEQLTERLHAAGIPARCHYTKAYRYSVGPDGYAPATVPFVHRPAGSGIAYFTADRMTRREVTAFVAGLCIAAQVIGS